jgi:hypothetical protein
MTAHRLKDEDRRQWSPVRCGHHLRAPIHWAVDSPPPNSLLVDTHPTEDNGDSAKCRLDSFINKVTHKRDSPLIREPPKQPPAKPVMTWRSRRLAAQPLS